MELVHRATWLKAAVLILPLAFSVSCRNAKLQTANGPKASAPTSYAQPFTPNADVTGQTTTSTEGLPKPTLNNDVPPPPPLVTKGEGAVDRGSIAPPPSSAGGRRSAPPPRVNPREEAAGTGNFVRIHSINDRVFDDRPCCEVTVRPGDVITFAADVFMKGTGEAAEAPVENFVWRSSLNEECSGTTNANCLEHSNFQLTDLGVQYYVPYNMPESIQITVESLDERAPGAKDCVVILRGAGFGGRAGSDPTLVLDPARYPGADLNPDLALAGMGRWVTIDQYRYFVPYTYVANEGAEWTPYSRGYWAWDKQHGATWISNDPWGWMTSHYGVWRHHGVYGWVWLPFAKMTYVPHTVSFFHNDGHIGWYPYAAGFEAYYRADARFGFNDGYWRGVDVGAGFANAGYAFHPGFTVVPRAQFFAEDINVVLLDTRVGYINPVSLTLIQGAFAGRLIYPAPGGAHARAHLFLEGLLGGRALPMTSVALIATDGGARFYQPRLLRPMPPEAYAFYRSYNTFARPVAVGTIIRTAAGGRVQLVSPLNNGRGLMAPPLVRGANGEVTGRLAPHTRSPWDINPNNTIALNAKTLTQGTPQPRLTLSQLPARPPTATAPVRAAPEARTAPPSAAPPARSNAPVSAPAAPVASRTRPGAAGAPSAPANGGPASAGSSASTAPESRAPVVNTRPEPKAGAAGVTAPPPIRSALPVLPSTEPKANAGSRAGVAQDSNLQVSRPGSLRLPAPGSALSGAGRTNTRN